jgi:hypothetical protein
MGTDSKLFLDISSHWCGITNGDKPRQNLGGKKRYKNCLTYFYLLLGRLASTGVKKGLEHYHIWLPEPYSFYVT